MNRAWSLLAGAWLVGCQDAPRLGFVGTLSGPGSEIGCAARNGMQLLLEDRGVEFDMCDDRESSEHAVSCIRSFKAAGIRGVVGPVLSSVAEAVAEEASRQGILVISPTVSTSRLTGRNDLFVKLSPDNLREAELLASRFLSSDIETVSVFYDVRNAAFTEPLAHLFDSLVRAGGRIVAGLHPYSSGIDLDFSREQASLPESSAVLVICAGMDLGIFQKDLARVGRHLDVYGTHWSLGDDFLRVGGAEAEGTTLVGMREQFDRSPRMIRLRTRFRERFGRDPSFAAVYGWEAAWLALKVLDVEDPIQARDRLLADRTHAPLGWPLMLDSLGDARRSYELCRIRARQYEPLP